MHKTVINVFKQGNVYLWNRCIYMRKGLKCIGMYFPRTRICKAIYSAALILTYYLHKTINSGQLSNKSTDYLRKDINIFSLSIFLKFFGWLYFDDHSSCLIAQSVAKTLSIFQNKKISYSERQQLLHVNGLWYSNWLVWRALSSVGVHSC